MRYSPGCSCCETPPPPCTRCSADSDTLAVTFAGFGGAYCDCDWLNATFILTRDLDEIEAPCVWVLRGSQACEYYYSPIEYSIQAFMRHDGSQVYWDVFLYLTVYGYTSTYTQWRWLSGEPTTDCTATRNIPFRQYKTSFGLPYRHICSNHASTTCQLN